MHAVFKVCGASIGDKSIPNSTVLPVSVESQDRGRHDRRLPADSPGPHVAPRGGFRPTRRRLALAVGPRGGRRRQGLPHSAGRPRSG